MCHCCPLLELTGEPNFETNLAQFSLGSCFACRKLKIKYTACVEPEQGKLIVEASLYLKTNQSGEFEVELPANTTYIKFVIKIFAKCEDQKPKCIKIIKCFPPQLEIELNQSNLTLRTTMQNCNRFAIDASGYDHANAREQMGPCRASRAMAIVHIAMFEAYLAIVGGYQSYLPVPPLAPAGASVEAA